MITDPMARLREYKKELITAVSGVVIATAAGLFMPLHTAIGWAAGYILGMIAVAMHVLIVWLINDFDKRNFIGRYYLGIFFRFLLTLGLFTSLLILTEIEHFSFTLSFIISYIFYSVIDMILINKKFTKRSSFNS